MLSAPLLGGGILLVGDVKSRRNVDDSLPDVGGDVVTGELEGKCDWNTVCSLLNWEEKEKKGAYEPQIQDCSRRRR